MNTPTAAAAAAVAVLAIAGCSATASDETPTAQAPVPPVVQEQPVSPLSGTKQRGQVSMPNEVGASMELTATGTGAVNPTVPVTLEEVTCAPVLPGMSIEWDTYEDVDAVADPGNQLCMARLAVTNTSDVPVFYTPAGDEWVAITSDNISYSETDKISEGNAIAAAGLESSEDGSDLVQPGETEHTFVAFELPADAQIDYFAAMMWYVAP